MRAIVGLVVLGENSMRVGLLLSLEKFTLYHSSFPSFLRIPGSLGWLHFLELTLEFLPSFPWIYIIMYSLRSSLSQGIAKKTSN